LDDNESLFLKPSCRGCNVIKLSVVIPEIAFMKNMVPCFFLFLVFVLAGCNKIGHGGCFEPNSKSMEGLWELRKANSMLVSDYPPGNGRTIRFTGNSYEKRENGQVIQSGEFSIVNDASASESTCMNIAPGQFANRIIYDNNMNAQKVFVQLTGDQLIFMSGCFALDGGVALTYVRQ